MLEAEHCQVLEPVKHQVPYSLVFLWLSNSTKFNAFGTWDSQLCFLIDEIINLSDAYNITHNIYYAPIHTCLMKCVVSVWKPQLHKVLPSGYIN